jgi:hypothetical protein
MVLFLKKSSALTGFGVGFGAGLGAGVGLGAGAGFGAGAGVGAGLAQAPNTNAKLSVRTTKIINALFI